jgi:hypothetical protein
MLSTWRIFVILPHSNRQSKQLEHDTSSNRSDTIDRPILRNITTDALCYLDTFPNSYWICVQYGCTFDTVQIRIRYITWRIRLFYSLWSKGLRDLLRELLEGIRSEFFFSQHIRSEKKSEFFSPCVKKTTS